MQFFPTLDHVPSHKKFKKSQLTAKQENVIKCAKTNNTTYILKNKGVLTKKDLSVRDQHNNTALYYGVQNQYFEVCKLLL